MAQLSVHPITAAMKQAADQYYRLVLLVSPSGTGKTGAMQQASKRLGAPLVNVNLELSKRMLELTERQRALQLPKILNEIVRQAQGDTVLLDNIEIIFDVSLCQDPLRLLKGVSRNKTVLASWNGCIHGGRISYAKPGHDEYQLCKIQDFLVVEH